LSPDGTLAAVSSASFVPLPTTAISTSIYQNGTLVTSLSGWKVGWLDDVRLLVNSYSMPNTNCTGAKHLWADGETALDAEYSGIARGSGRHHRSDVFAGIERDFAFIARFSSPE
jgi:hypothetical protein